MSAMPVLGVPAAVGAAVPGVAASGGTPASASSETSRPEAAFASVLARLAPNRSGSRTAGAAEAGVSPGVEHLEAGQGGELGTEWAIAARSPRSMVAEDLVNRVSERLDATAAAAGPGAGAVEGLLGSHQPVLSGGPGQPETGALPGAGAEAALWAALQTSAAGHTARSANPLPGEADTEFVAGLGGLGRGARTAPEGGSRGPDAGTARSTADARSAAAAARNVAGVDPAAVERSLDLLHPEFRVRLDRVVTRMEAEHGHRVEVVESLRHQARQNQLYEQGRTRPGPVVTWTRESNHTTGRAADVIIDGSYGNPAAYSRLHRIAAEEGLRTLGARDPGHLELPGGSKGSGKTPAKGENGPTRPAPSPDALSAAPIAHGVARPAAVAEVARPAAIAVARVAVPGSPGSARSGPREVTADSTSTGPATPDPARAASLLGLTDFARVDSIERPAATVLGSSAAERIAHLMDLQTNAPIRPLSQVFLRVEGPGGEDRIRLDLRGTAVDATMDISDARAADRLSGRLGELQRALEGRGLEAEALRVRTTPRTDTVEVSRAALAGLELEAVKSGGSRGSHESPQRDRPHDSARQQPQEGQPDARNRSRREPKEGRDT